MSGEERTFATDDAAERAAEVTAAEYGHVLACWRRISGRMLVNACVRCEKLVFVERPRGRQTGAPWYADGPALEGPCPGEALREIADWLEV